MLEAAKTLTAGTNSAIVAKNEAGAVPPAMSAEFKGLVARIYDTLKILAKTSDAAGTYASVRLRAAEAGMKVPKK